MRGLIEDRKLAPASAILIPRAKVGFGSAARTGPSTSTFQITKILQKKIDESLGAKVAT